jgi:hypothetical protein
VAFVGRESVDILREISRAAIETRQRLVLRYRSGEKGVLSDSDFPETDRVSGFEEYFAKFFVDLGILAFRKGHYSLTWSCSWHLGNILQDITKTVEEKRTRRSLIRRVVFSLLSLSDALSELASRSAPLASDDIFTLSPINWAVRDLPGWDKRSADDISYVVASILQHQAQAGVLRWSDISEIAQIGKHLGLKFPRAQELILDALIETAITVKSTPGMERMYQSMVDGIRSQRNLWGPRASEVVRSKVRIALDDLHEPAFSREVPW